MARSYHEYEFSDSVLHDTSVVRELVVELDDQTLKLFKIAVVSQPLSIGDIVQRANCERRALLNRR